jgi:hypothetical protein
LICAGGEWLDREMTQSELVAASRQKGKWTDGGMPLGYDIKGKSWPFGLWARESEPKVSRNVHYGIFREIKSARLGS